MPDSDLCVFGDQLHQRKPKHEHDYTVGFWGAKRCSCGSRTFVIVVGGVSVVEVVCVRCRRRNYSATAYEHGRHDGPREVVLAGVRAPF